MPFGADYQVMNSAVALTALRTLDPEKRISDSLMTQAVLQTKWSGRMQQAVEGIIFDGAHNPDGVRQLCDAIRQTTREGEAALLFSAVSDKAYTEMIRELCGKVRFAYIVVTRIPGGRGVDAGTLAAVFAECTDAPVCAAEDPKEAFRLARDMRKPDQTLFCAGSLYLIGELEKELEKL